MAHKPPPPYPKPPPMLLVIKLGDIPWRMRHVAVDVLERWEGLRKRGKWRKRAWWRGLNKRWEKP